MKTYQSSLDFLYGLQQHGIKLGLEAIDSLLSRLGHPHKRYATLHIGGTNGKGSTAAMVASILHAAGYRVGLYTSPHLVDFTERIRVGERQISEEAVAELVDRLRAALGIGPITFFEFTTALAFQHFADENVEVAVIEVGMGGRFDATNVITPLVSAITNVALDHQAYLGQTVGAIAFEKAGIIKPHVPVVLGRLTSEAMDVIAPVVLERQSPCFRFERDFQAEGDPVAGFHYVGLRRSYHNLSCPLPGRHQLENAACALAMVEVASEQGFRISEKAIRSGLQRVRWEGRLEIVEHRPLLLLDGAHNPAAAKVVAAYLADYRCLHPESRVILVTSIMRDKDREEFFRIMLPVIDTVIVTQAQVRRASSVEELRGILDKLGVSPHESSPPAEALALARRLAAPDDVICVTGSLMLVGEVKALLRGCGVSPIRG